MGLYRSLVIAIYIPLSNYDQRMYMSKIFMHPLFCPLLGPKRCQPLIWTNLYPHLPSIFPTSLVEIGLVVLEKIFDAVPYILLCQSLSPCGGAICDPWDFIWTQLNLFVLGMLHAKYCPIWCVSSWEEHFLSISLYITMLKFKLLGWGHAWP